MVSLRFWDWSRFFFTCVPNGKKRPNIAKQEQGGRRRQETCFLGAIAFFFVPAAEATPFLTRVRLEISDILKERMQKPTSRVQSEKNKFMMVQQIEQKYIRTQPPLGIVNEFESTILSPFFPGQGEVFFGASSGGRRLDRGRHRA